MVNSHRLYADHTTKLSSSLASNGVISFSWRQSTGILKNLAEQWNNENYNLSLSITD